MPLGWRASGPIRPPSPLREGGTPSSPGAGETPALPGEAACVPSPPDWGSLPPLDIGLLAVYPSGRRYSVLNRRMTGRICDIVLASIIALMAFPFMIVTGIIIFVSYGAPVFYSEERVGLRGKKFTLYKFRTLSDAGLDDSISRDLWSRINKDDHPGNCRGLLCRLLRKYSIDELPQLWNVFMGDMSIVGPRPMPAEELHCRFDSDSFRILSVRPGLTGLWQVSGRNNLSREQRRMIDLHYVDHKTPWLDLKIVLRTFSAVLSGRGAY